ncbi:MAG: sugar O-acyltransferase [Betaproteobacteria bacterium HGW-Betaproteobacteria-13]|jgi:sugar O-acyltransferase (sialic acid O-acetyltransferase NeuD family)|nr:MAG: sugar O-acyltransferase [Betaproteobacteria bacterium HGW-Betaproteobacteria-13]
MTSKSLIIVGNTAFAEIAYEYFTHDSDYQVVAFSVERPFLKSDRLFGLPVVPFEDLRQYFPPSEHAVYVAATYSQVNRLRTRLARTAKGWGYALASYVSSRAFVWRNVPVGEHCFIFEDNTVQPFVRIGNNCVLWSGNHVGHHSVVRDNCFISSQVVISGFCDIGENSFLGVNATISNNVTIGRDNWVGPGVTVLKSTEPERLFRPTKTAASEISALDFFKVAN